MSPDFADVLAPHLPLLGAGPLTERSRLRDLGLDSMRAIDLLLAIEDRYDVEFPVDELNDTTFETAGGLWAVVGACSGDVPAAPGGDARA